MTELKWYVLRRLARTVLFAYLLLSGAFFAFALTPDPNRSLQGYLAGTSAFGTEEDPTEAAREAMETYDEVRNRDRPLLVRYWDWVSGYATLQWGYSFAYDEPIADVFARAVPVTLLYVVPAVAASTALSALLGTYAALSRGGVVDRVGRVASALAVGLPVIVLASVLSHLAAGGVAIPTYDGAASPLSAGNLAALAVPGALVAGSTLAVQWRTVRAEALALAGEPFVKTLRAGGADRRRLGRHVLRNAAAPLLALFTAEALVALLLTVYVVESVLGVPGVGDATLVAFEERDIGLILGTVLFPAFVGLLANFCKDLLAGALDPRVSRE